MGGDFIEIIAFVIGLLYFIFRSNKKKEEKAKRVPPQRRQTSQPNNSAPAGESKAESLEDIFREIVRQQQNPTPTPTREPAKTIVIEEEHEKPLFQQERSELHKRREKIVIETEELEDEELPTVFHDLGRKIDLKQAVIHDAILNRPY